MMVLVAIGRIKLFQGANKQRGKLVVDIMVVVTVATEKMQTFGLSTVYVLVIIIGFIGLTDGVVHLLVKF